MIRAAARFVLSFSLGTSMDDKYESEDEIVALVRSFEDATVARGVWKHAEHLVVALCYVDKYDLETATTRMRDGLFNLLVEGFKVDLTKEMPYHETLTVFWMRYGWSVACRQIHCLPIAPIWWAWTAG